MGNAVRARQQQANNAELQVCSVHLHQNSRRLAFLENCRHLFQRALLPLPVKSFILVNRGLILPNLGLRFGFYASNKSKKGRFLFPCLLPCSLKRKSAPVFSLWMSHLTAWWPSELVLFFFFSFFIRHNNAKHARAGLRESFQVYCSYNFEEVFIFLSEFSP